MEPDPLRAFEHAEEQSFHAVGKVRFSVGPDQLLPCSEDGSFHSSDDGIDRAGADQENGYDDWDDMLEGDLNLSSVLQSMGQPFVEKDRGSSGGGANDAIVAMRERDQQHKRHSTASGGSFGPMQISLCDVQLLPLTLEPTSSAHQIPPVESDFPLNHSDPRIASPTPVIATRLQPVLVHALHQRSPNSGDGDAELERGVKFRPPTPPAGIQLLNIAPPQAWFNIADMRWEGFVEPDLTGFSSSSSSSAGSEFGEPGIDSTTVAMSSLAGGVEDLVTRNSTTPVHSPFRGISGSESPAPPPHHQRRDSPPLYRGDWRKDTEEESQLDEFGFDPATSSSQLDSRSSEVVRTGVRCSKALAIGVDDCHAADASLSGTEHGSYNSDVGGVDSSPERSAPRPLSLPPSPSTANVSNSPAGVAKLQRSPSQPTMASFAMEKETGNAAFILDSHTVRYFLNCEKKHNECMSAFLAPSEYSRFRRQEAARMRACISRSPDPHASAESDAIPPARHEELSIGGATATPRLAPKPMEASTGSSRTVPLRSASANSLHQKSGLRSACGVKRPAPTTTLQQKPSSTSFPVRGISAATVRVLERRRAIVAGSSASTTVPTRVGVSNSSKEKTPETAAAERVRAQVLRSKDNQLLSQERVSLLWAKAQQAIRLDQPAGKRTNKISPSAQRLKM